jgi:hypothetical protein
MNLRPKQSRKAYLLRALSIAFGLVFSIGCIFYVFEYDESLLWLIIADGVLIACCGSLSFTLLKVWLDLMGASGVVGLFVIGMTPVIIPLLAPFFLIWNLFQAVRTR